MNAPVCPINRSQSPKLPVAPTLIPSIPIATDLESLIRAINIMIDILRTRTTTLTINNTWLPQMPPAPIIPPKRTYLMSPYPDWYQSNVESVEGYIFYKAKGKEPDKEQRAYIQRTHHVEFRNTQRGDDQVFHWRYKKEPDSEFGESNNVTIFKEDFFERIVNVKWDTVLAVEFGDKAGGPPPDSDNMYNTQAAAPEPVE